MGGATETEHAVATASPMIETRLMGRMMARMQIMFISPAVRFKEGSYDSHWGNRASFGGHGTERPGPNDVRVSRRRRAESRLCRLRTWCSRGSPAKVSGSDTSPGVAASKGPPCLVPGKK